MEIHALTSKSNCRQAEKSSVRWHYFLTYTPADDLVINEVLVLFHCPSFSTPSHFPLHVCFTSQEYTDTYNNKDKLSLTTVGPVYVPVRSLKIIRILSQMLVVT